MQGKPHYQNEFMHISKSEQTNNMARWQGQGGGRGRERRSKRRCGAATQLMMLTSCCCYCVGRENCKDEALQKERTLHAVKGRQREVGEKLRGSWRKD